MIDLAVGTIACVALAFGIFNAFRVRSLETKLETLANADTEQVRPDKESWRRSTL
jgi:hypothetical protein